MISRISRKILPTVIALSLGLAGCGGSGGGGGGTTAPTTQSVSGGGVKGPLANAVVTVYDFDASQAGFKGAVVATASTNASAAITGLALPFPIAPPYIMEFTSTPGTTTDITTGTDEALTIATNGTGVLTLDSGTTGNVNLGTGNN